MNEAGVAFGKSRSDCDPNYVDEILKKVELAQEIPGDIVEVGSWRCGTSIAIASSTDKQVYAFDLFGGLPYGAGSGFESFGGVDFNEVLAATQPYSNLHLIRGIHEMSVPAWKRQRTEPLSLIFLDSDFYSSHVITLINLSPLLSPCGGIIFHDWSFEDVQQAIRDSLPPKQYEASPMGTTLMGYLQKLVPSLHGVEEN